jgi:hypothetical protein
MIPSQAVMYLDVASYDLEANKIAKKYIESSGWYKFGKIKCCETGCLLSNDPTPIKTIDFTAKDLQNPLENEDGFIQEFVIEVSKAGFFNAFVGSFSAKLCDGVFLNTMPIAPQTHWKQSLFFISNPI